MKEGYKKTAIGEIPEDWEVKELKKIAAFRNGKAHENNIVEDGDYILINSKFISSDGQVYKMTDSNLSPLFSGEIAMVMSDVPNGKAIAKCFFIQEDSRYTLNQRICSIKPQTTNHRYLFYVLNRNRFYLGFDNGVGQTNLKKDEVLQCPIPLPPLPEQQKIANILSTVDEKIEVIGEQICKIQELKRGLMQRLLTKGIGHNRFKDSPLGRIPESWEEITVGDILDLVNGKAFKPSDWENEGLPIIRIQNLNNGNAEFNYFNREVEERYLVQNGDLLFAWSGTKGVSFGARIWKGPKAVLNQHIFRVIPNAEFVLPEFTYYLLKQIQERIENKAHGFKSSFVHVKKSDITNLTFSLPPLPEQQKIANILTTLDAKLEVLQDKNQQYQELKKGLMQQLLTGKKRVKIQEPEIA